MVHDGVGAESYDTRDEGRFEVWYNDQKKEFRVLVAAYFFYLSLNVSASIWDFTDDQQLLESKTYVCLDHRLGS